MIPILFENTETTFTSNGLGRLVDCTRCLVTEERNGVYELEFDIPISSKMYPEVNEGRIIAVTHDDGGDIQPFDIYHRTAPLNGIVTFYAHHISYRQNGIVVKPFTASGVGNAITGLKTNSVGTNPFTYTTDKTTAGDYTVSEPQSLKALLGGTENSLLDVFGGGEYKFDKFTVSLLTARGTTTDVQIRYGKNLSDISHDIDYIDAYNGIVPYWYGEADDGNGNSVMTLVTLSEWAIYSSGTPYDGRNTVYPMNLTDKFEAMPTENELRTMATSIMSTSEAYLAKENITVSFVQMWQTEEYKSIAPLQSVKLCDTVSVYYEELGVDISAKVIRVVYNTLLDRYDEIELGQALETYAAVINSATESQMAQLENGLVIVQNAASQALSDAASAASAAASAVADAGDALIAAGNAVTAAGNAMTAAQNAQDSAYAAQTSANDAALQASTAGIYANSALDQLGIVQDVVGVLDLLSTNANYQLTTDTEVQPGKWYFTRSGYPGGSYTGDVVTFETTAGKNIDSLTADIEPIQDLNGYNAPWVGGAGKNKLPTTTTQTVMGITFTANADGTVTANNTATAGADCYFVGASGVYDYVSNITTGTYKLSGNTLGGGTSTFFIVEEGGTILAQQTDGNDATVTLDSTKKYRIFIRVNSGKTLSNQKYYPMLRASTETSTFEPYENICPISGHTDVVVSRTGKNLCDTSLVYNGYINVSQQKIASNANARTLYLPCKPNTTYTVSKQAGQRFVVAESTVIPTNNVSVSNVISDYTASSITITTSASAKYIVAFVYLSTADTGVTADQMLATCQIELGSRATTYEAYEGNTYTIALGTTVYDGTLDVTTGTLTIDKAIVTYDGSDDETWLDTSSTGFHQFYINQTSAQNTQGAICNRFEDITLGDRATKTGMVLYTDTYIRFSLTTATLSALGISDIASWKTWLGSNNVQVVYPLATPTTTTLTAQEISTLLGENNVWANSGTVNVVLKETYAYSVVTNPVDADLGTYYEITSIDQAVESYVTSRLAVTSDGLWVQDPGMATKILLSSTDGVVLYGPNGSIIGKYGSTAQIGDAASFHIEMDGTELGFYQADRKVAYISNQQLYITQSVVLQQMDLGITVNDGGLGQWSWKVHPNGATPSRNNLNLKWIG